MNKEVAKQAIYYKAFDDFYTYRRLISPKDKVGQFYREITGVLQNFYTEVKAGLRPELIINTPPQHGKSSAIVEFAEWIMAREPDWSNIYSSYSDRLGVRANMKIQRDLVTDTYKRIAPNTRMNSRNVVTVAQNYKRNSELIEIVGRNGSFRNTTVGGAVTGETISGIGFIDDPLKGRAEANSKTMRDKVWDWYLDDFRTRFSDTAGLLVITTRWHIDDLAGRLERQGVRVVKYQAINEQGQALFPELKSLDFLLETKARMQEGNDGGLESWEALYQQNPIIKGGNLFKEKHFKYYTIPPKLVSWTMYADTAMKEGEKNDYSVFQVWAKCYKGEAYLVDMIRGKWEAPELLNRAIAFWNKHPYCRALKIEDKASGTGLIQTLKRKSSIPVIGIPRSKDKVERANDVTAYFESGRVYFPQNAPYLSDLISEIIAFPNGVNDDQVDPMLDALSDIFIKVGYNYAKMLGIDN